MATEVGPGSWYAGLQKASFNPPNWVFPVAWNLLYATIALAGWLIWKRGERKALHWWAAQLVFNLAWSWIFFRGHAAVWALAEMLVLWLLIATTVAKFWRIDTRAGALLLPYLAWVTFAITLNGAIVALN
ncbi:tryptophan-rich sensory protein [Rhodospirillales bacterium TMPK1]|uniref:Tryptophan-rich sensory protein n=1 Tax=Roseiterribacter gracilis TaxID=2812848 RepID=A0A8S8XE80_9PROT|nr:tryptophan-rich sensory protein [Rhodospirillales bacterium TMPK1]